MIDVTTIDPTALPCLPVAMRKQLPACPSIYFVMEDGEPVYIGRSINLNNRWVSHHRLNQLSSDASISWLEVSDPLLLDGIERALIDYFCPRLNGTDVIRETKRLPIHDLPPIELEEPNEPIEDIGKKPDARQVAWKLRQLMAHKRIGNADLAKHLGVHPNTVSRWKQADEMPKVSGAEIDGICGLLDCSVSQLLGIES
jgi:DNA-binding Xre family transcriptional regulator